MKFGCSARYGYLADHGLSLILRAVYSEFVIADSG